MQRFPTVPYLDVFQALRLESVIGTSNDKRISLHSRYVAGRIYCSFVDHSQASTFEAEVSFLLAIAIDFASR